MARFARRRQRNRLIATSPTAKPAKTGQALVAKVEIEVDGNGPTIECDGPTDGAMINAAPGSSIAFSGSVNSPNGVASVKVNGTTANLAGSAFSLLPTRRSADSEASGRRRRRAGRHSLRATSSISLERRVIGRSRQASKACSTTRPASAHSSASRVAV